MLDSLMLVRIFEGLRVIVGLTIIYFAFQAYRRGKSRSMILLVIGFILLTTAGITEGVMFDILHFGVRDAQAARSAVALIGLLAVLYSIIAIPKPEQRRKVEQQAKA
ncbi:MAG: hypothetical protein HYU02_06075 [Thaumarchaeota archaeon]|nr:hypothetical protein [Nitrososphaerota archaeon]